jgi:hypothetical protein
MIRLTVRDQEIVQTVRIDGDKAFVGRSASNTIVLGDPGASRKHCILRVRDGSMEILDLNSRNGLKVNGQTEARAILEPGDLIEIGDAELKVEAFEPPEAPGDAFGGYDDDSHRYAIKDDPATSGNGETTGEIPAADAASKSDSPILTAGERAESGFADDLYRVLRRTPAWASSALLHLAIVFILFQIPWPMAPTEEEVLAIQGGLSDSGDEIDEGLADLPDEPPAMPELDEMDEPELPDVEDDLPSMAADEQEEEAEFRPPVISPSADAFRTKVSGLGTKTSVKIGANESFGTGGSGKANQAASKFVMRAIGGEGGRLARLLRRRPPAETLVIRGTYDRVENVLDLFKVPYTIIDSRELATYDLSGVRSIFANCSNEVLPRRTAERIGAFVKKGGYLFSTDWALENVVEKAFPRTIQALRQRTNRKQIRGTPDMVVGVKASLRRHFFIEGTGLDRSDAQWWLEDSSYPIKVLRKDVEVLVDSDELKQKYGTGAVAVTFRWGEGRVVHVMGHYYQKKGNLRGTFAMQKIITNFLVAAIRKR